MSMNKRPRPEVVDLSLDSDEEAARSTPRQKLEDTGSA